MELYFPLILDGATGTELQKRGFTGNVCAEQWVLEHPETICEIQKDYIAAGSQIVYASTFGGNRVKLEEHGIFNKVNDYNTRLAGLSREAAQGKAYIAGDMAPTGKFLAPMGDTSFEEMVEIYAEQAAALEQAGVDLFVIETMMTVPDARAALLAVKSVSKKPVFVSFTCDEAGKTLTGSDVTAALVILQSMGADAFGLNCSVGPRDMLTQLKRLHEYAEVPLIAKPNAGMPQIENGRTVYRCLPEEFTECMEEMAEAGVSLFGGCCGTNASHIKAIAEKAAGLTMHQPSPSHPDLLIAATEKKVFPLKPDVSCTLVLPCTEQLGELLEEASETDEEVIGIRIEQEEELDYFADEQYAIDRPLCLFCEDASLLEQALRLYQGRALYEGSLSEEVLLPLSKKYGVIY